MIAACLFMSGCLTSEFKELRITLNDDGKSGKGSVLFTDISSEQGDDTVSVATEDFNSLIADYVDGKSFETANPGLENIRKRLFVQNGKLMGEITFEFDDISAVGLYRHKGEGQYLYYTLADGYFTSGQYASSNGSYGGEKMPIVFWSEDATTFYLKMNLASQAPRTSLAAKYEEWQKRR